MKRSILLLCVSAAACRSPSGTSNATNDDASTAPAPKNTLRAQVTEFLHAGERAGETMAKHAEPVFRKQQDLDFGAKLNEHVLVEASNKSFGCRFTTLERGGKSIAARAACWNLGGTVALDPPPAGIVKQEQGNETVLTWKSESGLAAYRDEVAKALGPVVPPSPAPEGQLKDDYEVLTEPFGSPGDVFGYTCFENRAPTTGGEAVKRIGAARRVDMLRAIARGPNPVGRLFAADWLDRMKDRPTKDDLALRAKLEALPVAVSACSVKGVSENVKAPRAFEIVNGRAQ